MNSKILVQSDALHNYNHNTQTPLYQNYHDTLTRLPNRALFYDRIQQSLMHAMRHRSDISLFLIKLKSIAEINKAYGHNFGDLLLQEFASRLKHNFRQSDTIARLGGLEFAIILSDISANNIKEAGNKILEIVKQPFTIKNQSFSLNASLGVAIGTEATPDVDELIRQADIALQYGIRNKSKITFFDEQPHLPRRELEIMADISTVIQNNELVIHYQPKIDIHTGKLSGVEALLRWNHPRHNLISPEEFIPLAESTIVFQRITRWVMDNVLAQYHAWRSQGWDIPVAINLSYSNLLDPNCHDHILALLDNYDIPDGKIELELTESTIMSDPAVTLRMIEDLKKRGIKFSIDDFGTGYSSLAYLKKLPVECIKIDKSFVSNMTKDDNDAIIVRATIEMAHNLGLKVIAEGIEDKATWDLLQILRCDMAQGYYVSQPMRGQVIPDWLEQHNPEQYAF